MSDSQQKFDHEIDSGAILKSALLLAVTTLVAALVAWAFVREEARNETARDRQRSPLPQLSVVPPSGPQLQAAPEKELAAYRAEESVALEAWAWVDSQGTLAQVPVERALQAVAEEGQLPEFPPLAMAAEGGNP